MIDFGFFYNSILGFVGDVFGLFAWLGNISYSDFADFVSRLWTPGVLIQFTNVITGLPTQIVTTGFSNVFLAPFIAGAQLTVKIFNTILNLFQIDYSLPMWFVCSIYLMIMIFIFGLARGIVKSFLKVA